MIISASRRTDIPSYYSEWFINRIKEGFVCCRNPINAHQVSKISLDPEVVDCIVFWTKNPIPMLPKLEALKDYNYYFQFTLTGYGKDVEANLPDKKTKLIPAFRELSEKIGPERVIWRYDPIAFNERYTEEYHLEAFSQIADALSGYTNKCVISFVDVYQKVQKNMDVLKIQEAADAQIYSFAEKLYSITSAKNMTLATCAEKIDLSPIGIEHNACIDKAVIEQICGAKVKVDKDKTQRDECQCVASIDVGAYNTCANGCKYCYANFSPASVQGNMAKYNPMSLMLCDEIGPDDKVTERKMKSLLDRQLTLF